MLGQQPSKHGDILSRAGKETTHQTLLETGLDLAPFAL